jgi:uncharacterized protein YdeI (YjbR/CyaY-like superfamily)
MKLPESYENIFKANSGAWEFFINTPTSYKKTIRYWILSAKQEKTQLSRLNKTISACEKQKRIF